MNRRLLLGFLAFLAIVVSVTRPSAQSRPIAYVPTGTGFIRTVSGVETNAAQKVPLDDSAFVSGTLAVGSGGTGLTNSGDAGGFLTSTGSGWGISYSGGWQTIFDLDFTTLPSQTLGTDGSVTIDGIGFTKNGSSKDGVGPLQIINGTGLTVTPAAGSLCFNAALCPLLYTQITSLVPDFEPGWKLRITVYDTSTVTGLNNRPDVNYGYFANTLALTGAAGQIDGYGVRRGMLASSQMINFFMDQRQGNLGGAQINFTIDNTNAITELFIPHVWWNNAAIIMYSTGSNANFVNRQTRVPLIQKYDTQNFNPPVGSQPGVSAIRLYMGFDRDSTNPFTAVVRRWKVEYNRFD